MPPHRPSPTNATNSRLPAGVGRSGSVVPFRAGVPVDLSSRRPDRPPAEPLCIDCGVCAHQGTAVCDDCVVTFIVGREPEDAVVVDAAEARAVRMLEDAGLLPGVRHSTRAG
jgi:hypothetical protein